MIPHRTAAAAAAAALGAALIAAGCAGSAPPATRGRTLAPAEVMARVLERDARIASLGGGGSITIESPDGSASGSFDLALKKPDSMRVDLSGPFGIRFGTLMLSRNAFLFYNRMENTALVGKPDGRTLNAMFRLRMEFDEILHAFTGEFTAPGPADSIESSAVDGGLYVLRYRAAGPARSVREYRVDGDDFVVTSYRLLDSTGKPLVTAVTSDPDDAGGIPVRKLVRVIFPRERRAVTIAYDDIRLNEPVTCYYAAPAKAEVIGR